MKKIFLSGLLIAATISFRGVAQEWTLRAPMPTARYFPSAALTGGNQGNMIYVLGGINSSEEIIADNEAYNVSANSWKVLEPMPTHRMEFFTATVGKKIYAIGGFNYESTALNVVEIYNPETNTWSEGTPMPTSRSQITGAVVDGKIYLTGGWPSSFATLEIYDPATDTWTTGSPAPIGINHCNNGVAVDGSVYTFGGANYGGSINYDKTFCYNPVSDEWDEKAEMPDGRYAGAAALYKEKVHYFGGSSELGRYHTYDNHYVYDPTEDVWVDGIDMEENRGNMVAVTASDGVYVIGGYIRCDSCDAITDLNKRYTEDEVDEEEPSSINDLKKSINISLYPNPATNEIKVTVRDDKSTKRISLADMTGKVLKTVSTESSDLAINTSDLSNGVYLLTIHTNKGISTQKVSISR